MARVYGYLRVSTEHQDLQRQKVLVKKYCEENELNLVGFIEEKVSGAKSNRKGVKEILQLTKEDADIVIISDLSRLSREDDIMNVISKINTIRQNGLDLLMLDTEQWIRTSDTIDAMKMIQLVIRASENANERRKIANRMSTGRYAKLVENHYAYVGGQIPFGFSVKPNPMFDENATNNKVARKILVENPKEILILDMMYSKIADGYTLHRLAKYMIDNGIIISDGNLTNYQTLISDILHNKLYIGERTYKGEKFEIKPIISNSKFKAAMDSLEKNRWIVSYSSNFNPLKGILKCTCGRSMYYTNCKQYKYYKCYKKKDDGENRICSNMGLKAETAFKAIWKAATNAMSQEKFKDKTAEKEELLKKEMQIAYDNLAKVTLQKVRKQNAQKDIVEKIKALTNNKIIASLEKEYEGIELEINEIDKQKSEVGKTILAIHHKFEELEKISKEQRLESLSLEYKSELLHNVIEKAVWCSDTLRKGFLQINFKNSVVETLLIQTDKTHSLILQLPTTIQLDLNERKVSVEGEMYSCNDFLKRFDYTDWVIEETIVDGFKQRKSDQNKPTDEELLRMAEEPLE